MSEFEEPKLEEGASVRAWIGAFAAILIMVLGFAYYTQGAEFFESFIPKSETSTEPPSVEPATKVSAKKKKRKRRQKSKRGTRSRASNEDGQDEGWQNDEDWEDPGLELGDISEQRDAPTAEAHPAPKYEPTVEEYQPSGVYKPVARYHEPGASTGNVTTLNMAGGGGNAGLSSQDVRKHLSARKLMACYTGLASKVDALSGEVNFALIVESDGHVSSVRVTRSTLRSRVVEKCMVGKIRRIRFPRRDRATKFSQEFSFR